MKEYSRENLRNIALISHHGAGKTTLGEAMLYVSGTTDKLGNPDDNTSILDYELEEQHRKMSINAHVGFCEWKNNLINFIDTPGFPNFLYESESAIRVVDGIVVVVDGHSGIKAPTDKLWNIARNRGLPRLLFMNKLGMENADFERMFDEVSKVLNISPAPLTLPIGSEESFSGIIDLIELKALTYTDDGKSQTSDVPEEMLESAQKWREKLLETIAESNDELLEKYLDGEEIDNQMVYRTLRDGVLTGVIVPLVAGSATKLIGIDFLLNSVGDYLPSPLQAQPAESIDSEGGEIEFSGSEDGPFAGLVFKTISDPYTGKINIMRVFSGKIAADLPVFNSTQDKKDKLGHLSLLVGRTLEPVSEARMGDIVAINKLKETSTGDTLCDESNIVVIKPTELTPAVLSFAIEPKTRADDDKLMPSLAKIKDENPTIQFNRNEQTNEFLISGTGQVHVEVTVEKLRSTYGVDIDMKTPKVPYMETIMGKAKAEGKYVKQTGGRGQYGDVWLEISRLKRGSGFEFENKVVGGAIPKNFIPSVKKGVKEAMQKGILAGYPVTDLRATVFDGKHHSVDSSDIAFQIAGSMALKNALEMARSILLEPLMSMEIVVQEDHVGDVISDLNARRGKVSGVMPQASGHQINAEVPMAEILSYAPELRSITSGQATFSMSFSHYEEVPAHMSEKVINEAATKDSEGE